MSKNINNSRYQLVYDKAITPQSHTDLPAYLDTELSKIKTAIDNTNKLVNPTDNALGFKNRIINGNFSVDQYGYLNSAVDPNGIISAKSFLTDLVAGNFSVASKMTAQLSSITDLSGFTKCLTFTSTATYTPSSGDAFDVQFPIEGKNIADLYWGTATAKPISVSFWVKSNKTGTWTGSIRNLPVGYSFGFTFTVNTSGVWEYKTITIPAPTVGTWNNTNGVGIILTFDIGSGSNYLTGTGNSWVTSNYHGVNGSNNLMSANGQYFSITGIQLENGTRSTNFDNRPYDTELTLCKRYCRRVSGGQYVAHSSSSLYFAANQFYMKPAAELSGMRKPPGIIDTQGTQGTDWYILNTGNVAQTGFTLGTQNGIIVANKTAHGLTAASLYANTNGAIILTDNIYV